MRGIATLRDFDDKITAYYCGFAGASDYYDRAAASHVIDLITVPTFIFTLPTIRLSAFFPTLAGSFWSNPNITFVETEDGGHCSYLAAANGNDGHWAEIQLLEFLRNHM